MCMTIANPVDKFNEFLSDIRQQIAHLVVRRLEAQLEVEVEQWLHRGYHVRRVTIKRRTQARCQRCGTREASAFSRNGHRQRQLVSVYGVLNFWLPRVVCSCGGSVSIPFSMLKPYQQIWEDVISQIGRWAELGLSLRQMQGEIGEQMGTQVGLRTLNEVVQTVPLANGIEFSSVPPIIMLDAIWVTLLEATGTTHSDRLHRQRSVKARQKVCVLVALGLYPQTGRWGILGWHIAPSENQEAWEALLTPLEARGVYRQRGLELFIHDGGKGLIAALDQLYPHVPHQRCAFHKLRNLWQSIQAPTSMTPLQRRTFKHDLLHQVRPLFSARDERQARDLREALSIHWHDTQPAFVATLQRDWHDTVAFFRVLDRFPTWRRSALQTTSLLERVNRMLRRLFRAAGAFHSLAGLVATVARVLNPKRLI